MTRDQATERDSQAQAITAVEGIVVRAPLAPGSENDDNPSNEVLLTILRTDGGLVGLGECNHHPAAARAFLSQQGQFRTGRGVSAALIGRHPREREHIIADLQWGNFFSARRGIGLGVLSAIDTALWDLCAQMRNMPLWKLLWGEAARPPVSYQTIYTGAADWPQTRRRLRTFCEHVLPLGHPAVKIEPLVDCVPEEHIGAFAAEARELLGPDLEMLVDFGYRMPDAGRALKAIDACVAARPLAIETPCHIDAFAAWAATASASPIPIAGAELLEHPEDFQQLLEGGTQILQPWPARVGITGTLEVIKRAQRSRRRVILGGWNATTIGLATGIHLAAGITGAPVVLEHAARSLYGFPLRAVAGPEPQPVKGRFDLPTAPGLGVRCDWDAIDRLRVA